MKAACAISEAEGDLLQIFLDADITDLLSFWLFLAVAHDDYLKTLSRHHASRSHLAPDLPTLSQGGPL